MSATIVRYRVHPGREEENVALVRAVYAELEAAGPPGFRYATFLEDDGRSFVHVALTEDGAQPPLSGLAAFARFTAGIEERCQEPPRATRLTTRIAGYRL
jgi:hypothetical protein